MTENTFDTFKYWQIGLLWTLINPCVTVLPVDVIAIFTQQIISFFYN